MIANEHTTVIGNARETEIETEISQVSMQATVRVDSQAFCLTIPRRRRLFLILHTDQGSSIRDTSLRFLTDTPHILITSRTTLTETSRLPTLRRSLSRLRLGRERPSKSQPETQSQSILRTRVRIIHKEEAIGTGDMANVHTVRGTSMVTIPLTGTMEEDTHFTLLHNQHTRTCQFHSQRTGERKHTSTIS